MKTLLLSNGDNEYWIYSDDLALNRAYNIIEKAIKAFTLGDSSDTWSPSTKADVKYVIEGAKLVNGTSDIWTSDILIEFPNGYTYEDFAAHYPELLI